MFKSIWIAIISTVAVVGGLFGGSHATSTPAVAPAAQVQAGAMTDSSGKKLSFTDLMNAGGSYECTVEEHIGSAVGKGTIYLANGNTSGEFTASAQGKDYSAYFITAGGYTYSWSSLQPASGFKFAQAKNVAGGGATGGNYAFNAEQVYDYKCSPWTPDQGKFAPPSSVKFMQIGK